MKQTRLSVVRNEADNTAKILLYGVIGDYWSDDPLTAQQFVRLLTSLEKNYNTINVHIHSPGGNVWEGLAICNAIKASKKTINTYNDGIAMSMGACILACGKNRFAAKGSITMIHNASTISWGTAETLRQDAEMLDTTDEVLAEYFADAMNTPVAEIQATYFDHKDHFLSAKDAEKLGLFTIIDIEAEYVPENVQNMPMHQVAALYRTAPKNEPLKIDNNMFGKDKFKSLSALAKVAAAEITAEQVEAVNNEIETEGIPGVTLVLDSQLQTITDDAGKLPALNKKVTDLEAEAKTAQTTIDNLNKEVADLKKAGGKPAAEADGVKPEGTDGTPKDESKVEDNYETSFDRELKAAFGK